MAEGEVDHYYSDDYAGMSCGKFDFYYGYEDEDPDTEEWRFSVTKGDEVLFLATTSQIEEACSTMQLRMPQDYLVSGIGMWIKVTELI